MEFVLEPQDEGNARPSQLVEHIEVDLISLDDEDDIRRPVGECDGHPSGGLSSQRRRPIEPEA